MYFFVRFFKGPRFYIISKRKCLIYCLFMAGLGAIVGTVIMISSYASNQHSLNTLTVIVDAGHGLPDGGTVGVSGSIEQKINLDIALKLKEVLDGKNIKVIMTRENENGLWDSDSVSIREKKVSDMNNRLKIMEESNADLFISIHMNSYPNTNTSGLRVFYAPNHKEIMPLAEYIQKRIQEITGAKTTVVKSADKSLFLMKNPPVPAILVECGFLSNHAEEKKLQDSDYQARLAWAIADAIENYYN